jgi:hypothetical protein
MPEPHLRCCRAALAGVPALGEGERDPNALADRWARPPSHPYSPAGLALVPGSGSLGSKANAAVVDPDAAIDEAEADGEVDEGEGLVRLTMGFSSLRSLGL